MLGSYIFHPNLDEKGRVLSVYIEGQVLLDDPTASSEDDDDEFDNEDSTYTPILKLMIKPKAEGTEVKPGEVKREKPSKLEIKWVLEKV